MILMALSMVLMAFTANAQSALNDSADSIVGLYESDFGGDASKIRITKEEDGTYNAQVYWLAHPLDKNGKPLLDEKNPDKKLRNTPVDRVVLIEKLQYVEKKHNWGNAKIYDPTRGFKANVTCWFSDDSTLKVKGSLIGISETIVWKKVQ